MKARDYKILKALKVPKEGGNNHTNDQNRAAAQSAAAPVEIPLFDVDGDDAVAI
jgi:hypothetical protein